MRPPAPESVLDRQTLNRTLLARQGLLARGTESVGDMVEHLVGLQAQVPRDPYVALWARVRDFVPAALEGLLLDRAGVRMTLMRATLHLATSRDAPVLRAATQAVCERSFASSPFRRRVEGLDLDAVCAAGATLVEEHPLTVTQLGAALGDRWPGQDREAMAYAVRYLVPLVQVTPRGLLSRSAAPRLTTLRSWLGPASGAPPPDQAADGVIERYLRAFGPATVSDVRAWSGIPNLREIVARMRPRLRSYRDLSGRELLDVADGVFASPDEPAPVRFLGEYDNVFLGHADRSRITGDLTWGVAWGGRGAFFVDGYLAGAWRLHDRANPVRIEVEAHRLLTLAAQREVALEASGLVHLLAPGETRAEVAWAS